jgi:hypothetical protein
MSSLYSKLSKLGLNQDYVRQNGLPSWWDDELNEKPLAVLEGAGYIAKRFGLDFHSLLSDCADLHFKYYSNSIDNYNNINNNRETSLNLLYRLGEIVVYGTKTHFVKPTFDVERIKAEIKSKNKEVNLISLLNYCWSQGIIVVCFNQFPQSSKNIYCLLQFYDNSPVIILDSSQQNDSNLVFNLAYYLGYLALGYLPEEGLIEEKFEINSQDKIKQEVYQFADNLVADNLVEGNNLLNDENNSPTIINQYLAERIDWDCFDDDTYEYLIQVLGV